MKEHAAFFKNFLRSPFHVGAITPSSSALVHTMLDWFDWTNARAVVEFGPGSGVFTQGIINGLQPEAKFFAIERSAEMVKATRRRCPGVTVYEDTVTNVADLCRRESISQVNAVISGLPWASFTKQLQTEIMDAMFSVLVPGGQFATFAYLQGMMLPNARHFAESLEQRFAEVERSPIVWRNLPPAFVYRCVR